jgi:manganese transport protein
MSRRKSDAPGRSLEEVNSTVRVSHSNPLRRLFAFLGPAYLVSVGYMDPGNWATDLAGGAQFGYALVWVLALSNLMAVLLQTLSARLGLVTRHDLAQACRAEYPRSVTFLLWLLAEVAIAATDLAEVLGTIIALKLLFGMPLLWGCLVTAFDTFLLLYLQRLGMRAIEAVILVLVLTIGGCFLVEIVLARPDLGAVAGGLVPSLPADADGSRMTALFIAIGILGATVMPHNLYLHSALVQSRRVGRDRPSLARACRYNLVDSAVALNAAFFVNAAILVLAGATFFGTGEAVDSIEKAHELLPRFLGSAAPILFGIALLAAGQSSTLTGTLAGQIVMEGYLHIRLAPWLRRLVTRMVALVPAVVTIALAGEGSTQHLLVLSQVVLSLQLPFAVIPLIHFTSDRRNMGEFTSPVWVRVLAWIAAGIIVALNLWLVGGEVTRWVRDAWASDASIGPVPMGLIAAVGLWSVVGLAGLLLGWVAIKPLVRPAEPWTEDEPATEPDWSEALRPRSLKSIGVALERGAADTEILNRALSLAEHGRTRLVLLHVVDTPMTRVFGADADDRHSQADGAYLESIARVLESKGYPAEVILLYGPNRARELVLQLRREPVDLLVVGSHGHGWVRDLLYGQTIDSVRHGLEIPMMVARPDTETATPPESKPNPNPEIDPETGTGTEPKPSDGPSSTA